MGAEHFVGQTVRGWLKRMKDGWGFMNSDVFSGDLFVHARENPGISDYPVKTEFFFTVSSEMRWSFSACAFFITFFPCARFSMPFAA